MTGSDALAPDFSDRTSEPEAKALCAVAGWSGAAPAVDPRQILRVHRYTDPEKVRPAIREAAERVARQVTELAAPAAAYRRARIACCEGGVLRLDGGVAFGCEAFGRLLGDCSEIVAFVLTLGPGLDEKVIDLMEEFEPLDALFVESAGWLSIERCTRQLAAHLGRELQAEGLALVHRMGPGYSYRRERGDVERVEWPLTDQTALFEVFGEAPLPVELLSSCAMKPKMSRSGLFGVTAAGGGA